jgi:hypothetical protein
VAGAGRAGPGATLQGNPALSNGLFWYVLTGGLQSDDSTMGAGACIFFPREEPPFEFHASAQGVELVQMQLPID